MICGRKLLVILLFLSAVLQVSFLLKKQKKNKLKMKSRTALIEIVLIYDEALTDLETSIAERESGLDLREKELNERESEQDQIEKLLIQQGDLLATSLTIHRQTLIQTKILKWVTIGLGSYIGYDLISKLFP